jgi:hypothetical protein
MSELTIEEQLQSALTESAKATKTLSDARAKLAPLESAAQLAAASVNDLIKKFQLANGFGDGSGVGNGKKKRILKPYNITPESKIGRVGKAAYTRAKTAGLSDREAKKAQADAEASLKLKLGVG